jgi:hypothetical protein
LSLVFRENFPQQLFDVVFAVSVVVNVVNVVFVVVDNSGEFVPNWSGFYENISAVIYGKK